MWRNGWYLCVYVCLCLYICVCVYVYVYISYLHVYTDREVLGVARRLVKEREEVVRELSRLHDHMVEAHDTIVALRVLAEENNSLRDRVNGVRQSTHAR